MYRRESDCIALGGSNIHAQSDMFEMLVGCDVVSSMYQCVHVVKEN